MTEKELLINRLNEYSTSDMLPMHMPGHKRQEDVILNPFKIDITEIDGFDNLHHPKDCLLSSMNWAASVYKSDATFYLVNGSTCGVLSAICSTTSLNGQILLARNSHKSAFHAVMLNQLNIIDLHPEYIPEHGISGSINPASVTKALSENPSIEAVFIVSPTYEGVCSDITAIAEICHSFNVPLIVDEAHGAHLSFLNRNKFTVQSALSLGADIVIQSLHKTLPSLTQTALIHVKSNLVDINRLKFYLQLFQSSSPSYLFLSSIEKCIYEMYNNGEEKLSTLYSHIDNFYDELGSLKAIKLLRSNSSSSKNALFSHDKSRVVIFAPITGTELSNMLRNDYHIEMEMAGLNYCIAILTINDDRETINRFKDALIAIDNQLSIKHIHQKRTDIFKSISAPDKTTTLCQALDKSQKSQCIPLDDAAGKTSAEFVYVYPPGIPIIIPGEKITPECISLIHKYHKSGYSIQGMQDESINSIKVLM